MALQKEPPGLWFLTCDQCGERVELDTDPDDDFIEAAKDARKLNWRARQEDESYMHSHKRYTKKVWVNICPDCQQEEKQKTLKAAGL